MIYMISDILYPLLNIDVKTLVSVLFWGNLISMMLVFSFHLANPLSRDKALSSYYVLAKLFQSVAYFMFFFRGVLPDVMSVNGGNTLLIIGFYWEARSMLTIIKSDNGTCYKIITALALICIVLFNMVEVLWPDKPPLRVFVASICVFLTLCLPTLKLLFGQKVTNFKRVVRLFYIVFLSMLLPRAFAALENSTSLLSNSLIQTMTFLALVLLMIFSLSAYLLLIKEGTDKILHAMATTDALTGLWNRYTFIPSAERMFDKHKSSLSSLALVFFDIDDFKQINDKYGHGAGDTVLQYFAEALRKGIRNMDIACRYGGEEFLVLLPRANADAALMVGQRVQNTFAKIFDENQTAFTCTISGGIATGIPDGTDTLQTFINRADSALYAAKKTGKNKLLVWEHAFIVQP